jgi:hypothetical protein
MKNFLKQTKRFCIIALVFIFAVSLVSPALAIGISIDNHSTSLTGGQNNLWSVINNGSVASSSLMKMQTYNAGNYINRLVLTPTGNLSVSGYVSSSQVCIAGTCNTTWPGGGSSMPNGRTAGATLYYNGSAWATSTNIYNNGGNIGIGTTVPGARLDVEGGDVVVGSGSIKGASNQNLNIYGGSNPSVGIAGQSLMSLTPPASTSDWPNGSIVMKGGDQGASYPQGLGASLTLQGSSYNNVNGASAGNIILGIGNSYIGGASSNPSYLYIRNSVSTKNVMAILSNGFVGIGIDNPVNGKLEVDSTSGTSIYGWNTAALNGYGVYGGTTGSGFGVYGYSASGYGVFGNGGSSGYDFYGAGPKTYFAGNVGIGDGSNPTKGILNVSYSGSDSTFNGISGYSNVSAGVRGVSTQYYGVAGVSYQAFGVNGLSMAVSGGIGVYGYETSGTGGIGVYGVDGGNGSGVYGYEDGTGYGVQAYSHYGIGVYSKGSTYDFYAASGAPNYFSGPVYVNGLLGVGTQTPDAGIQVPGLIDFGAGAQANTLIGNSAGFNMNSSVIRNTYIGASAGYGSAGSTAIDNTALGVNSLNSVTNGGENVAVGNYTLSANTTGSYNTAVGYRALQANTSGTNNVSVGMDGLYSNTTGHDNTTMGIEVLRNNLTGNNNTAVGEWAFSNDVSGSDNTVLGYDSATNIASGANLTSVNQSIFIGERAESAANGDTNEIVIGNNAVGIGSNTAIIGNPSTVTTELLGNVGIGIANPTYKLQVNGKPAANGYTAFTNYSDARLKKNINYLSDGYLAKIMELKPATFQYNSLSGYDQATQDRTITGFVAQDMKKVFPNMVGTTTISGTQYYDTDLSALQVYSVKAIQEQQAEIDAQQKLIDKLQAEIDALKSK